MKTRQPADTQCEVIAIINGQCYVVRFRPDQRDAAIGGLNALLLRAGVVLSPFDPRLVRAAQEICQKTWG